jgi:hypothetical protein
MEGKAFGGGRVLPSTRLQMLDGDNAALRDMPFQPEPAHITPSKTLAAWGSLVARPKGGIWWIWM